LADTQLIETLAHFPRERIPERVVHAKAAGAWGEFEVTDDLSDLTDADFLSGKGKKTPLLARISTTGGERGAADTVRDIRGWSMKLFTQEGNQDFVFNSLPVFFIRDPIKFPSVNRSHKRHPVTNIADPDMFWDYHVNNQEGIHALMHLFGLRGIPKSVSKTKTCQSQNPTTPIDVNFLSTAPPHQCLWRTYIQTRKARWHIRLREMAHHSRHGHRNPAPR
jgi:catalase